MTPTIQTIVVPTDFTARADRAVDYAAALARSLKASVHLVHIIEEPFFVGGEWDLYVRDASEVRERLYADAWSRLSAIAARLEKQSLPITTEIRRGSAVDGIIGAAMAAGADLIVMSTHGRSGVPHLLLGSVAASRRATGQGRSRARRRPRDGPWEFFAESRNSPRMRGRRRRTGGLPSSCETEIQRLRPLADCLLNLQQEPCKARRR